LTAPTNVSATLLLLLGLAVSSSPAAGQLAVRGPAASILFSGATPSPLDIDALLQPGDSIERDIRPTHWKEGALVGGLVGAVGGILLGRFVCGLDESNRSCTGYTVGGAVGGAALLAITGALIGGQFPKGDAGNTPPPE